MIQPVSPSPLPATGLPGDVVALPLGEGPAGPDFGALLALEGLAASPPVGEAAPLPAAAVLAATPANPGKILPSALPETANLPADLTEPEPAEPAQSAPPVLATAVQLPVPTPAKAGKAEAKQTKPEKIAPEDKVEPGEAPSTAAPLPVVLPVEVAPVTVLLPVPAAPEVIAANPKDRPDHPEAEPKPIKEYASQSALHRTIPTLPANASDQARAQMLRHTPAVQPPATEPVTAQPIPTEPEVQAAQSPAPQSRAVPAEEIRVELALPRLTAAATRTRDETQPLPKWAELALSDATPAATSAQPLVSAPALISPAPQVRPHDFAALIERIAVAREAVAPQAVSITLSHQDFGQVRLNFRPEDAGLSISMTSPDPDFARAAAAMPAPVLPVAQSDQAALSQHQRSDGGPAQNGSQTQSRGGGASEQRRDGQPQPQSQSHPRGRSQNSAARADIFA